MTKEEILGKGTEACDLLDDCTVVVERDDALAAMDEWAKQQSIAFGNWMREQRPDVFYGSPTTEQLLQSFENKHNNGYNR